MATVNIRGIPDRLYRVLKKRAEEEQRSINQQVIWLLQKNLLGGRACKDVWAGIDARRDEISEGIFSDSVDIITKDRGR